MTLKAERTHFKKSSKLHHKTRTDLKPSRQKEEADKKNCVYNRKKSLLKITGWCPMYIPDRKREVNKRFKISKTIINNEGVRTRKQPSTTFSLILLIWGITNRQVVIYRTFYKIVKSINLSEYCFLYQI